MAKKTQSKSPGNPSSERIIEFEVSDGGTLRMAGFVDAETRAQFYEHVADRWERSRLDLANAMDECQPLAWEVQAIYSHFRDELLAEIKEAEDEAKPKSKKIAALSTCEKTQV